MTKPPSERDVLLAKLDSSDKAEIAAFVAWATDAWPEHVEDRTSMTACAALNAWIWGRRPLLAEIARLEADRDALTNDDWQVIRSSLADASGCNNADANARPPGDMQRFFGMRSNAASNVLQKLHALVAAPPAPEKQCSP